MTIINSITESKPYSISSICNLRNLHLFPERRKNRAENFVQGAKKAVKIQVVQAKATKAFSNLSSKVGAGLLATWMLVAPSIPGLGPMNVRAQDQIAMNTPQEKPAPAHPFDILVLDARAKEQLNLADAAGTVGNLAAGLGHRTGALIVYGDSQTEEAQNLVKKGMTLLQEIHGEDLPVSFLIVDTRAFPKAAEEMFKRERSAFVNPSLQIYKHGFPATTRGPHGTDSEEDWQDLEDTLRDSAQTAKRNMAPPLVSGLAEPVSTHE